MTDEELADLNDPTGALRAFESAERMHVPPVGEARPAEPTQPMSLADERALRDLVRGTEAEILRLREQLDAATGGLKLIANGGYGDASIKARAALAAVGETAKCDHEWVDMRNEVIKSGEWCPKCNAVCAGHTKT